jgi:DNA-directed RNA polymerase specialized sigma24 family protein
VEPVVTRTRPTDVDAQVRDLLDRGQASTAASVLLDKLGADVFGFLVGVLGDTRRARAAYAGLVARVTAELPAFRGKCSSRVWLYSLARRELDDRRTRAKRAEPTRSGDTGVWRQAGMLAVIGAVRRALSEEERELLILRVDRLLDWQSLAITQLGEAAARAAIAREANTLRRRLDTLLERIESLTALHLRLT